MVDHIFSKEMMRVFLEDNWSPADIEAYLQNLKDDPCDGVDCGLEC